MAQGPFVSGSAGRVSVDADSAPLARGLDRLGPLAAYLQAQVAEERRRARWLGLGCAAARLQLFRQGLEAH
eukprot:15611737-Heterocapsa_arctica.AAC.1